MTNKYENNIIDAIETIVDNAVANAGYDKTIKATIIECIDQTIGKFKVKKQDGTFSDYIPIGADAENIDLENGNNLQEEINSIKRRINR